MSNDQYDNTNRGAVWQEVKAAKVSLDVRGETWRGYLCKTHAESDNAPSHDLLIWPQGSRDTKAVHVVLFRSRPEQPSVLDGTWGDHWVNVYQNDGDRGPKLRIELKLKQRQDAPAGAHDDPGVEPDDSLL